ncbi:benzoate-CoA ligase family protein [Aquabacterium sp. A08]|uniref:benzoate-CoA ligase family protein n=1 Tax=Aquabacterium sp. A08 TaxID=2718532 RepID=UPI0014218AA2|nr:benzoate-CoA ligase family protein [Aquabacterium sp. A08]NIC40453.1 benzoate-CoA ligase family protein [Aquabacterium sp. A08]
MTARPPAPPPTEFNFAQHLIRLNAGRGERVALIDDQGRLTYAELADRVRRMANGLQSLGLRREERVLLLMQDSNDWIVSFLGALYAGVVPVCLNTLLTAEDYAFMLNNSRAQAALVSEALLPTLEAALEQGPHEVQHLVVSRATLPLPAGPGYRAVALDALLAGAAPQASPVATLADEAAFWLYSSGSTGRPKGTVHTQANLYWTAELYAQPVLGLTEDDTVFSAAKLFFAYGLGNGLSFPLSVGATVVLMAERPTPQAVFQRLTGSTPALAGRQPTVFYGAPTGYGGMLAQPDLPPKADVALRLCSSAGEALPRDIGERWTAHFGAEIIDGIGSTEMLHIFLSNRPGDVRYGTTGKPVPGYEVELRGEDGLPLAPNADGSIDIGDLYVKGPSAALMYWHNREKSRDTFQGAWTKSGDKYSRDAEGYYTYAGRNDDMLKVSGIYVSPFEVEATLVQHPAILEAAVIGTTGADGLTKTKAFIVLKAGQALDEDGVKAFCKEHLAPYKYPRQIEFVTELPKTATGKIQRFKLRDLEAQRSGGH